MNANIPALPPTDLEPQDLKQVESYMAEGLPGLDKVADSILSKVLELYLDGKTYHQISRSMRLPKVLVMYLSHKFNWYPMKLDYRVEVSSHLHNRVLEAKVNSQDFLLQLQLVYQKRIGKQVDEYFRTGDEKHVDGISLKEIEKYIKIVEAIDKLSSEKAPKKGNSPLVGLNLGSDGVNIKKVGENQLEVTPKEKSKADKLKEFADLRRQQEALAKTPEKSDITVHDPKQGETNET